MCFSVMHRIFHVFFLSFSAEHLGRKLDEYVSKLPVSVHVVRSEKRTGLIRARLRGRISFGQAIVCAWTHSVLL